MAYDNLKTALTGYARYRGLGHAAFLMHRLSGLATLIFLTLHIATTATVFFVPRWYDWLIQIFRNPLVMAVEIILAYFVVYHGVNGLRIAYTDIFRPHQWTSTPTRRSMTLVMITAFILWLPALGILGYDLLRYGFGLFGGE